MSVQSPALFNKPTCHWYSPPKIPSRLRLRLLPYLKMRLAPSLTWPSSRAFGLGAGAVALTPLLDWSSSRWKVLGVFIGPSNLEEINWRPRIDALDHVLKSWRSRSLSFCGKALVINALVLSRVWYAASLIHMPAWVCKELSSLAFSFFWSGRREFLSRSAVTQSPVFGFSAVVVRLKLDALLSQWVKRFVSSPSGWCASLSFCFVSRFGVCPLDVFSRPFSFDPRALPPFYQSLLPAWQSLRGSLSHSYETLVNGLSTPLVSSPVLNMSTNLCYSYLLSENRVLLHCMEKFNTIYENLD